MHIPEVDGKHKSKEVSALRWAHGVYTCPFPHFTGDYRMGVKRRHPTGSGESDQFHNEAPAVDETMTTIRRGFATG
jgi:hypothetical protein